MLRDITIGQYFPGTSVVHRTDPRLKLVLVIAMIVTLFLASGPVSYALLALYILTVIKISGNPMTVKAMRDNIDVDVSGVINQGLTLDQATDIVQDKLVDVCWGAMTSSDMLGEIETAASRLLRTL